MSNEAQAEALGGARRACNWQFAICNLQFAISPRLISSPAIFADGATALPPPLRAKLLLALIGLVVLGIGLAVMALLGGRAAKRLARHRTPPSTPADDAWYKQPLKPRAPADAGTDVAENGIAENAAAENDAAGRESDER